MASRKVRQSGERQVDKPLVPIAPATEEPMAHDSTRYQGLRADQLLADIDQKLFNVAETVGNSRKLLYDCNNVLITSNTRCSEFELAYRQEQQCRIDYEKQYSGLYHQHQKAIKEIQAISCKCLELQQQLESNREATDTNSPIFHEAGQSPEVEVALVAGKGQELSLSEGEMAEHLKDSIRNIDQGSAEKRQDHEKKLTDAVDHVHSVTQKVDQVDKMYQPTSAEQSPASVSVKAEIDDSSESRGRAKRARKNKQT